jgi:rsbT co-antagonist protein RsbR
LARREEENRELIERLRVAVDDLSTPVLEVWDDVLTLPVVGIVDTQRSAQMTDRVLNEVVNSRARYVIVDLTGVAVIDTSTADRFLRLARAVQLLGARCIVTGIQPAVSQTLVELGVEFGVLETHRNLKSALAACIRRDGADAKGKAAR